MNGVNDLAGMQEYKNAGEWHSCYPQISQMNADNGNVLVSSLPAYAIHALQERDELLSNWLPLNPEVPKLFEVVTAV
jgi:hypothetical protein